MDLKKTDKSPHTLHSNSFPLPHLPIPHFLEQPPPPFPTLLPHFLNLYAAPLFRSLAEIFNPHLQKKRGEGGGWEVRTVNVCMPHTGHLKTSVLGYKGVLAVSHGFLQRNIKKSPERQFN